ncbi:MAG: holo-ACP synthase [Actinobacteria bacterium]|nr:holo-ACP synthase [Actinomycetota bacterium]
MDVYGVGVDIVEVERVGRVIERYPGFIERVYTEKEIKYCEGFSREKYIYYAVRFAAKEAVAKSMAHGIGKDFCFRDIELDRKENGAPFVRLSGKALTYQKRLGIKEIKISFSHTREYAVAFALAVR